MPGLQRKSFATPDQVRIVPSGRVEVVRFDEIGIGRFVLRPDSRGSKGQAPTVRTRSCRERHVGYAISGWLRVIMDDGAETVVAAGGYEIPPGHEVISHEPWEGIEFAPI